MLGVSDQKRRDCRAMCVRHIGASAPVLVNLHVAEHRMAALHATVDQSDSHAWQRRTASDRAGSGSFRRTFADRAAVQINVIEVVDTAGIELAESLQRAASRHPSGRLQNDDRGVEPFERARPPHGKSLRPRTLERSR